MSSGAIQPGSALANACSGSHSNRHACSGRGAKGDAYASGFSSNGNAGHYCYPLPTFQPPFHHGNACCHQHANPLDSTKSGAIREAEG
jgi:hypothetical protein